MAILIPFQWFNTGWQKSDQGLTSSQWQWHWLNVSHGNKLNLIINIYWYFQLLQDTEAPADDVLPEPETYQTRECQTETAERVTVGLQVSEKNLPKKTSCTTRSIGLFSLWGLLLYWSRPNRYIIFYIFINIYQDFCHRVTSTYMYVSVHNSSYPITLSLCW